MDILKARKKAKKLKKDKEKKTKEDKSPEITESSSSSDAPFNENIPEDKDDAGKPEPKDKDIQTNENITEETVIESEMEEEEFRKQILKELEKQEKDLKQDSSTVSEAPMEPESQDIPDEASGMIDGMSEEEFRQKILKELEEEDEALNMEMNTETDMADQSPSMEEISNTSKANETVALPDSSSHGIDIPPQGSELSEDTYSFDDDYEEEKIEKRKIEDSMKALVFKIGREFYGIDIMKIKKIDPIDEITRVPNTPDFVLGIISLRGEIIPILDLKKKLKIKDCEGTKKPNIIILNEENVGIIIDIVEGVREVKLDTIERAVTIVGSIDSDFITGIVRQKNLVFSILDIISLIKKEIIEDINNFFSSLKY